MTDRPASPPTVVEDRGYLRFAAPLGVPPPRTVEVPAPLPTSATVKARARTAITGLAMLHAPEATLEVGRLTRLGQGLFREAWAAPLRVEPDSAGLSEVWVALVPRAPSDVRTELAWLAWLQYFELPFTVPRPLGGTRDGIVVRSAIPGLARKDGWRGAVEVAAHLHRLPLDEDGDRRTMALASLAPLRATTDPDVRAATAWCDAHVPDGPLVLTHGDLLPQNLLFDVDGGLGVIDWQFAGPGDPAHEIAVLTRGARRPFRVAGGAEAVIAAYLNAGGLPITRDDVRFHELAMVASWVAETGEDHDRQRLRGCLKGTA